MPLAGQGGFSSFCTVAMATEVRAAEPCELDVGKTFWMRKPGQGSGAREERRVRGDGGCCIGLSRATPCQLPPWVTVVTKAPRKPASQGVAKM